MACGKYRGDVRANAVRIPCECRADTRAKADARYRCGRQAGPVAVTRTGKPPPFDPPFDPPPFPPFDPPLAPACHHNRGRGMRESRSHQVVYKPPAVRGVHAEGARVDLPMSRRGAEYWRRVRIPGGGWGGANRVRL
eukprot:917466-Prymnesium_polylepis.1